jgi:hypothetical protein
LEFERLVHPRYRIGWLKHYDADRLVVDRPVREPLISHPLNPFFIPGTGSSCLPGARWKPEERYLSDAFG